MAEPISIQQLKDASLDVKSLEEVVNGDENVVVTTRLGETYPSVKGSIKKVFENGGLPSTPFANKTLMTASSLADGKYAMVTDDTVNNGLYVKTAGTWVKSHYDPITQAKTYTDSKITELKEKSSGTFDTLAQLNLTELVDGSFALVANDSDATKNGYYKKVGGAWAKTGFQPLSQAKTYVDSKLEDANLSAYNASKNLLDFEDALGNTYASFDAEANLHLENMNGVSVQDAIADLQGGSTSNRNNNTKRFFTKALYDYINQLNASRIDYPQLPYTQFPERFTVPDSIVNDIKLQLSTTPRLVIETPYRADDKTVHPHILEFANPVRGYRYIMALNPYTTDQDENPVIYGGNSLTDFKMLTGFTQPLDTPPAGGYLSDNGLTYDPINGDLIVYWRSTIGSGASLRSTYWCKRTKDLLNWSDKTELFKNHDRVSDDMISVSILYNPQDGLWHCWNVNGNNRVAAIRHRTATSIYGDWSEPEIINPQDTRPWHLEVKFVGDKFVMMIYSTNKQNLHLGVSNDGVAWKFSATTLFANIVEGTYKSTFLPKFNAQNQLYLDVLYTADNPELSLYNTQSNAINVEI